MTTLPETIAVPKADKPGVLMYPRQRWEIRELTADEHRYIGLFHPELAMMAACTRRLIDANRLSPDERAQLDEVESVLYTSIQDHSWWISRCDEKHLLPAPLCRPDPDDLRDVMPSWETFELLLGLIMRNWEFLIRLQKKYGIDMGAR